MYKVACKADVMTTTLWNHAPSPWKLYIILNQYIS